MITRSLSRLNQANAKALRDGPRHKGVLPFFGRAGRPGPYAD